MLYNNYDEYMRNVLGYGHSSGNMYENFDNNYYAYDNGYNNFYNNASNIEEMYPDIYKLINPMVCEICKKNNQPITEDLVEQMTNNIYDNVVNRVEVQNIINVNIETRDTNSHRENKSTEAGMQKNDCGVSCSRINNSKNIENRAPYNPSRPRRNRLLQDLIRVLLLNEFRRDNRPPVRPRPRPNQPGSMPMPPRPWF